MATMLASSSRIPRAPTRWRMPDGLRRTLGRGGARVGGTTALVLCVHFLRYAGPLIYVPLVVRLLPVAEAGSFFRYQSLGLILALFVEFGLSGTALRDWARQDSAADRSRLFNLLVAERLGNAACLGVLCTLLAAAGAIAPADLAIVLPFALASGLNMTWYFMASGRPLVGSTVEAVSQAVSVALLLAVMWATRSGAWATLAIVAGLVLNVAYGMAAARRDGVAYRPGIRLSLRYKLQQLPMFVVRVGAMISSAGSPWIVATFAGVVQAGLYGPSARLFGALAATMSPVADVVIPLISRHSRAVRRHLALAISGGALGGGAIVAAVLFAAAGPVSVFLYGPLAGDAAGIVRVLAVSVPFMFASQALSLFVLMPGGKEKLAAVAFVLGAAAFVALALHDPSASGAAFAKVASDVLTFAVMFGLTLGTSRTGAADA